MKKITAAVLFLFTLIMFTAGNSYAQVKQFGPGGSSQPGGKQVVKQKPFNGPEQTIIAGFWKDNPSLRFNKETTTEIPYELGYAFQSSKKGQVTQLGVRMPRDGAGAGIALAYTVSLWDYDTRLLLAQTSITTTDIRFTYKTLDNPASIEANKKYVVSVFIKPVNTAQTSWSYYSILLPGNNNSAASFIPFTQGTLTLLNTQSVSTNTTAFPENTGYHKDMVTGICDVVFKTTEK